MKEGIVGISHLSLAWEGNPWKSQLFERRNSYQTLHLGQTLGFVSLALGHQRNQSYVSQGSMNAFWANTAATLLTFLVLAFIPCIFCLVRYLLSCQLILHWRRFFLFYNRYCSCFQMGGSSMYLAFYITPNCCTGVTLSILLQYLEHRFSGSIWQINEWTWEWMKMCTQLWLHERFISHLGNTMRSGTLPNELTIAWNSL